MATVLCTKAATTYPVPRPLGGGLVACQYDTYTIGSALSKDDLISFFYLPPCEVTWGWMLTTDIDSGTEALELDLGDATAADPDRFIDSGVLTGDVITDLLGAHAALGQSNYRIFNGLNNGAIALTVETLVQAKVVAAAHTFTGTHYVYVGVLYVCA